jgi:hypothetical protein
MFGGDQEEREATPSPDRMTDISEALRYGLGLLGEAPHRAERLILNICSDGIDNVGAGPEEARELALRAGVSINGLVIGEEPGLAAYYRERVVGGPSSFVIEAREPADVVDAMLTKFLLDLQSITTPSQTKVTLAGSSQMGLPVRHGH